LGRPGGGEVTKGETTPVSWRTVLSASGVDASSVDSLTDPDMVERTDLGIFAGPAHRGPVFRWLPYKEAFSPRLVDAILDHWGHVAAPLLDPFAGMGTTLLAGASRGVVGVGTELLAYPQWAANAALRAGTAEQGVLRDIAKRASEAPPLVSPDTLPTPASSWALLPEVLAQLTAIRAALPPRSSSVEADLAHLALLTVVEPVSQAVKDGTSLRHRERHRPGRTSRPGRRNQVVTGPEVITAFSVAVDRILEDLPRCETIPDATRIVAADARALPLSSESVGAVITSPPYPNRYDYSAVYQLELAFGGFVTSNDALRLVRKGLAWRCRCCAESQRRPTAPSHRAPIADARCGCLSATSAT
jgi:hypothetical protein